jgi:hypothetical protein
MDRWAWIVIAIVAIVYFLFGRTRRLPVAVICPRCGCVDLVKDRMQDFQELADEAFGDLLRKHGRPTDLKAALRQSVGDLEKRPPGRRFGVVTHHEKRKRRRGNPPWQGHARAKKIAGCIFAILKRT